jgi:hypothetical protein
MTESSFDPAALQGLGISLPSPAYFIGAVLFGIVGLVAYYRGKAQGHKTKRWLGVALMFYPYAVSQTWLLYVIGIALSAAAFTMTDG